ncbi:MAG: glycosyltransferase family 4 protein [Candidatus Heimdallarchaeota archaeon]
MQEVLLLPTRFFPSISGAEFYFQRLAEILTSNYNYSIDIYTSNAIDFKALRSSSGKIITKHDKYFFNVNNLKINRFPVEYGIHENDILDKLKSIPAFIELNLPDKSLKKFINNGPFLDSLLDSLLGKFDLHYDLIHTTFFPYFNCVISLIIGKAINKPVICTPFFHFSNPRYLDNELIEVLKKFDYIIACTNLEKKFLTQECDINPEKIKVIPMGVDYEQFKNFPQKSPKIGYFKQKFFNEKEKKYRLILFCGYKNYEKGALSILKAIPYILKKKKKIYYVFIGPSTIAFNKELSKISKLNNSRIINFSPDNMTGYFDKKKIAAFKEADIYLMPSRSDAFGISFLEAWAAGKPVIGARIGATPEVIRENIDGLLVEFDNPIDIAQKVNLLLKNKKLKKKLGSNGQLKVIQNYTWEKVAQKTHSLYQQILNTHN